MLITERKRILIDTTFLFDQYADRGIGRYGKDLLAEMIPMIMEEKNEWVVHFIGFEDLEDNLIKIGFSNFTVEELVKEIEFHRIPEKTLSTWKNIRNWPKYYKPILEEVEPDIFFGIHFERGLPSVPSFKLSFDLKTVVPAHDTIPLIWGKYSSKGFIHNILKKRFYMYMWKGVQNADLVLAPSDLSKNDLVDYGKVLEEKITRIYLGVDESFRKENLQFDKKDFQSTIDRLGTKGKKYFFYDSGLEENKGISELLELFSNLSKIKSGKVPEYLVLTGGGSLNRGIGEEITSKDELGKNFLKKAKKLGILENIISTGRVEDDELKMILSNAQAYLYMTKYEGFGFGIVQAMAAGVPAIGTNSSCIPEITDGGALLVDVEKIGESTKRIVEFLNDRSTIRRLQKRADEVVLGYSWEKTAEESWKEIKDLVAEKE